MSSQSFTNFTDLYLVIKTKNGGKGGGEDKDFSR